MNNRKLQPQPESWPPGLAKVRPIGLQSAFNGKETTSLSPYIQSVQIRFVSSLGGGCRRRGCRGGMRAVGGGCGFDGIEPGLVAALRGSHARHQKYDHTGEEGQTSYRRALRGSYTGGADSKERNRRVGRGQYVCAEAT